MRFLPLYFGLALTACTLPAPPAGTGPTAAIPTSAGLPSPQQAVENFISVVDRVEPVAERICRAQTTGLACDYQIVVDRRPELPPNAFQTVDRAGRPIIAFTISLIAEARSQDELAFILGHEAAHHIAGHLPRQKESALRGAVLAGVLVSLGGGDAGAVRAAQDLGATVGARTYSKNFELEADALGTVIAFRAGYDPERGAEYFSRIDDPGNMFLGTHPANAQRIQTVRATLANLR